MKNTMKQQEEDKDAAQLTQGMNQLAKRYVCLQSDSDQAILLHVLRAHAKLGTSGSGEKGQQCELRPHRAGL